MEIVVNEWLLHHLCPDAEESDTNLALQFIRRWMNGSDKVVIRRSSPFTRKLYRFMKTSENQANHINKRFVKLYKWFLDSTKTIIVEEYEINVLPKGLAPKIPSGDDYLVELAYSNPNRIILTTDTRLKTSLADEPNLRICLLEEFLYARPNQN